MDFARTMVKLFKGTELPSNVFFKYGKKSYRITGVDEAQVNYLSTGGNSRSIEANFDRGYDMYSIRSVKFEGRRIIGDRRLIIDIGG